MELTVQNREKLGKASRILKKSDLVPAEVYGKDFVNRHVAVALRDLKNVLSKAGESTVINLILDKEKWPVLIHDVQRDHLSSEVIHVDFYKVKMGEKIKVHVQLEFKGEAPVVKDKLGILNKSVSEIEIEALPNDLPNKIEVDLSVLTELGKSIHIKDLKIPAGVKVLIDAETVVATVVAQKEEEKVEPVTEVSEVKVEGEEKKAEREMKKKETEGDKKV